MDLRVDVFGECGVEDPQVDRMLTVARYRYTVHEKAQNFAVPIPLEQGWHDEQIDELFSSLLGGAGLEGAGGELETFSALNGVLEEDIPGLDMQGGMVAGLRVF